MHEVATKLYVPNAIDTLNGLGAFFGTTTMVINGGLECTTDDRKENTNSQARIGFYKNFLDYFNLPSENDLGCATMQPFSD